MLEILSHQHLKKFMNSHRIDWEHIYSFGRIIAKCIQNNSTYLINSEIFFTNDWAIATFIALFLNQQDSTFILSKEKIQFFKKVQVKQLQSIGFDFILENDKIVFANHQVRLISLTNLLDGLSSNDFKNHRFIFSGIEDIKRDLKNYFRISLSKEDWINNCNYSKPFSENIISTYNFLNKKFFLRRILENGYLILNQREINFLSNFFFENSHFSHKFSSVSKALSQGWGCWVKLDNKKLEWHFFLEPIDELSQIKELLNNNKFVFLSALREDNFFKDYLKKHTLGIDLEVNFKSNFVEKKIPLYVPPKQLLPNDPFFKGVVSEKCKKLLLFRKGLSLVLADDLDLKNHLATELASKHGNKVLLEKIPFSQNQILCSSFEWWINSLKFIEIPEQIIIPLLPLPNLSEPINSLTVAYNKKVSLDWFREFLLPEALLKLERAISPLRRNSGKLIILDGRVNKRKWGRQLLQQIQPSRKINYVLPFD